MDAITEKKKPGTAFPHNIPAQSIYGRGAPGAQPAPTPAQPAAPAPVAKEGPVMAGSQQEANLLQLQGIDARTGQEGAAWKTLAKGFMYNSDVAAMQEREAAKNKPVAPATPANNPLRVQEAKLGVQNPGNAQAAGAPGAGNAPITSLGQGKDVGFGVTRFDVAGRSPLFTNMTDAAGTADNLALMNRGQVSAQNESAAQAMSDRGAQERAAQRAQQQFAAEAAQAQAINKASADVSGRISREMDFKKRDRELEIAAGRIGNSPQERMAIEQRRAELRNQFDGGNLSREKMAAEQASAQARMALDQQRLGMDRQRLGMEQQRVGNDLATGAQTREERGLGIQSAKQLAQLQAQYMNATDRKVKQQIARELATLSGKYEGGMKPQVIRGSDTLGDQGQVIRGGERLIGVDPETGQVIDLTPGGAAAAKPAGQQGGFVQGMTYEDPVSGEFAKWNGSTFVPIKAQK